jgi:Putative beta-barrel porin-2, OmpL-like. bbp2
MTMTKRFFTLLIVSAALSFVPRAVAAADQDQPALQDKAKTPDPFAFADFTWLNGNSRQHTPVIDTKAFTAEMRVDTNIVLTDHNPKDHTIGGSTEVGRTNEVQVQQLGIGGDFHWENVRGRLMTQFGMYSTMTPRNDPTASRGQWNLDNAYRYLSEAYGGYHFDKMNGINVDAGIFMSYIGLFSYYNYDNWAYQPSYVSSNTPWFFNGVRIQVFPNDHFKEEIWITNGWQSYGAYNDTPGLGSQTLWRPNGRLSFLSNNYFWGKDTLGNAHRKRVHSDSSVEVKYLDHPTHAISKAAFSLTLDAGCEFGGGVKCSGGNAQTPSQYFLGFMLYDRTWFANNKYALTVGGGAINNPGRYLVLLPPINGATVFSGTPYFTQSPGDPFHAWDGTVTFDYMPSDSITFRYEIGRRVANVPYFSGHGGITPAGGNQGAPGSAVDGFTPDLRKAENRLILAMLVKF